MLDHASISLLVDGNKFQDLLNLAPDAMVIIDREGRCVFINSQTERLFGYSRENLLQNSVDVLVPERFRTTYASYRSDYFNDPHVRSVGTGMELQGRRKDGSEFPIEINLSQLETKEGTLISSALRDITERKTFEKALQKKNAELESLNEKFRNLLEAAPDAMIVVNSEGHIAIVNTQAEKLFGYTRTELLQQTVDLLVPERFRTHHAAQRSGYFYDPHVGTVGAGMELYGLHKDGSEFPIEINPSPLEAKAGTLVSNAIRDITERKHFQRALQEKSEIEKLYWREQRIASSFQEASLPSKLPTVPGIVFNSYYGPGDNDALVGGDWYDAFRLLDGRIIISIGDVAGSGLHAAVIMSNMRQVIRGSGYVHPNPVLMLNAADKMLRSEHPDTTVTAFVGVLDPIQRTLTYASAGHPPPIMHLRDGTLRDLAYHGLLLGLRGHDELPPETISIEAGSCLILYTDGLTESNQEHGEGEQRLRDAMLHQDLYRSPNVAQSLYDAVVHDGARDDVAILTIACETLPVQNNLLLSRWAFDVNDVEAARLAQQAFTARLRAEGLEAEEVGMAELVFMELVGNIARYTPGQVEITADWSSSLPVLHVIDQGPGFSHNPKLPPDLLSESGRGIYLISKLTEEFQVSKVPDGGSHACAVLLVHDTHLRERKHMLGHIGPDSAAPSTQQSPQPQDSIIGHDKMPS